MLKKLFVSLLAGTSFFLYSGEDKLLHIDFERPDAAADATGRIALKTAGAPVSVPGVKGKALFFSGGKQAVRSRKADFVFPENMSFTISFYIKPERNSARYWPTPLLVCGLRFSGRPQINSPFLFMSSGKKRLITAGTGTSDYNLGKWHHIGLTRDSVRREICYFVDGKQISSIRETPEMTALLAKPSGVYAGSAGWINYYRGAMDELIIRKGVHKNFDLSLLRQKNTVKQEPVKTDPRVAKSWKVIQDKKLALIPAPKEMRITGDDFVFAPAAWSVSRKNPADAPGYDVFLKRLRFCGVKGDFSAGGKKRLVAGLAAETARELSRSVKQPPRQGYVLEVTPEKIVICGTDENGLRYGWLTLAGLLRENGTLPQVFIRDYPDFSVRVGHYSPQLGTAASLKKIIDELFVLRINCLTTTRIMGLTKLPDHVAEVNAYAAARGITCGFTGVPSVEDIADFKKKIPRGQDGHSYDYRKDDGMFGWYGHAISWSRDDMAAAQARRIVAFMKKYNFTLCILHPVDAGGIDNPSRWNSRSPRCRKRWGNDFFSAQEHLIGIYCDILKKSGCRVSYVAYPYAPKLLLTDAFSNHLRRLEKRVGKDVWLLIREGLKKDMDSLQKVASNFLTIFYPFQYDYLNMHCNAARYFCTFYTRGLDSKTGYEIWAPAGVTGNASRSTYSEYMWNAFAPGAENKPDGLYTSFEHIRAAAPETEELLLRRACAWIYGEKAADVMAQCFAAKFSLRHAEHPFKVLPAATDQEKYFAGEAALSGKILSGMNRIRKYIPAERLEDFTSRRNYVQRIELLSRARLHALQAHRLVDEGKTAAAQQEAEKGMSLLTGRLVRNLPAARLIKNDLDISGKIKSGALKRRYAALKQPETVNIAFYQYTGTGNGGSIVDQVLMQSLDKIGGMKAFAVTDPTAAQLKKVDVMIFAATKYVGDTSEDWRQNIRDMVEKDGKGVIFMHNAVGREKSTNLGKQLFPGICSGFAGRVPDRPQLTVADDSFFGGFLKKGDVYTQVYTDHMTVVPGKNARVLLRDADGNAVAVAGKAGKGWVVYTGEIFGIKPRDILAEPPLDNWKMLYHLIRCAAGKR